MSVAVLGAGITGLAAAYYLRQLRPTLTITVLEAKSTVGGWVRTSRHQKGPLFEHGPRTVRPAGQAGVNTLQLVEQLQLTDRIKVIPRGHPSTLNRMIIADGRLHRLPSSWWALLRPLAPFGKPLALAAIQDLMAPAPRNLDDDNLYAFVSRRFGERLAKYAIDPLVRGICAGDSRQISVRFLMNDMFEHEQRHGAVLRGLWRERGGGPPPADPGDSALACRALRERWSVWSLEGGLQTLPETLEERLVADGAILVKGASVRWLQLHSNCSASVYTADSCYHVQHVVSALPSHLLAPLVPDVALARLLAAIPSVTVAVINLEFAGNVLTGPPGFGYLIPSSEYSDGVLGVIYDTCSFSQPGDRTVLTVMAGGAELERHYGKHPTSTRLLGAALDEVRRTLGITAEPRRHCVQLQGRCIPQYVVGHRQLVQRVRDNVRQLGWPLHLAGAAYDGVSVNDCIMSGRRAAEAIAAAMDCA